MEIHSIYEGLPQYKEFEQMLIEASAIGEAEVLLYPDVIKRLREDRYLLRTFIKNDKISWNKKLYIVTILNNLCRDFELSLLGSTLFVLSDQNSATIGEKLFYQRRLVEQLKNDSINARYQVLCLYGIDEHFGLLEEIFPHKNKEKAASVAQYSLYRSRGILEGSINPLIFAWKIVDNDLLVDLKRRTGIIANIIYIMRSTGLDIHRANLPKKLKSILEAVIEKIEPYADDIEAIEGLYLKFEAGKNKQYLTQRHNSAPLKRAV